MDNIPYLASWANAGRHDDPADAWQVTAGPQLVQQARDRPNEPGIYDPTDPETIRRNEEAAAEMAIFYEKSRRERDEGKTLRAWVLDDLERLDAQIQATGVQVRQEGRRL